MKEGGFTTEDREVQIKSLQALNKTLGSGGDFEAVMAMMTGVSGLLLSIDAKLDKLITGGE
jgi:hypothetical protein